MKILEIQFLNAVTEEYAIQICERFELDEREKQIIVYEVTNIIENVVKLAV